MGKVSGVAGVGGGVTFLGLELGAVVWMWSVRVIWGKWCSVCTIPVQGILCNAGYLNTVIHPCVTL